MRRRTASTGVAPLALLLPLLVLLPPAAQAVQHFKGLTDLAHMAAVGITDDKGTVVKTTLLAFANRRCTERLHGLGFPFDYIDLPGAVFELGEVRACVGHMGVHG